MRNVYLFLRSSTDMPQFNCVPAKKKTNDKNKDKHKNADTDVYDDKHKSHNNIRNGDKSKNKDKNKVKHKVKIRVRIETRTNSSSLLLPRCSADANTTRYYPNTPDTVHTHTHTHKVQRPSISPDWTGG